MDMLNPALALQGSDGGSGGMMVAVIVIGGLAAIFISAIAWSWRYKTVGPNEVLIISGRKTEVLDAGGRTKTVGFAIVKGGGAWVYPVFEKAETLSLEIMTIDVRTPAVYSIQGIAVQVDGVAQIKVKGEDTSIRTAAEQFLSKTPAEIMQIAHQTLEGHLRAIIGKMTVEELNRDRDKFAQNVQSESATDFANMGLQIVSFTIKEITSDSEYLQNLGRSRAAEVDRDAKLGEASALKETQIGQANAQKDTLVGQANAQSDAEIAKARAQMNAQVQTAQMKQAGEKARYEAEAAISTSESISKKMQADNQAAILQRNADRDLAYQLQETKRKQELKQEEMKLREIEIGIKQKEMEATAYVEANAQKYRQIQESEARAMAMQNEGRGEAEKRRQMGLAEADVIRQLGFAEAEAIQKKGEAEAEAMRKKAEAWRTYNEAAIAQMFIERLPELARAIAEPLGRTDKITIISTGAEGGMGASRLTKDVVDIISQLPPILEGVSGINLKEMISKIPGVGQKKAT